MSTIMFFLGIEAIGSVLIIGFFIADIIVYVKIRKKEKELKAKYGDNYKDYD